MTEIEDKAESLARMLLYFQVNADRGQPAVVLAQVARNIETVAGELHRMIEAAEPATDVHVNPWPGEAITDLLSEYFDGNLHIPDSPESL